MSEEVQVEEAKPESMDVDESTPADFLDHQPSKQEKIDVSFVCETCFWIFLRGEIPRILESDDVVKMGSVDSMVKNIKTDSTFYLQHHPSIGRSRGDNSNQLQW